ncbi:MAG: glycosyltransferase [Chitinophagaceae bacterium]
MSTPIKLNVCMITYNHEHFIAQSLDSILKQKTNFPFNIIIGEDFSTDNTRQICLDYEKKFPDKIKVLKRDKNVGMMPNLIEVFSHCTDKYIAFCEGDDYWIDPLKLQKQVDFLEKNTDYAICCHDYWFMKGNKKYNTKKEQTPEDSDLTYLLRKGNYIGTLTVVYRNHPDFYKHMQQFVMAPFGDYVMHTGAAMHGKIKYMDEKMAVYRVHGGGMWSTTSTEKGVLKNLALLEMIYHYMPASRKDDLKIQMIGWLDMIGRIEELAGVAKSQELKDMLQGMDMPAFIFDYVKFMISERSHHSYYTRNVPLPVLLRAVGSKLAKKITAKIPS